MHHTSDNTNPCRLHAYCTGNGPDCTGEIGFNIAAEPTVETVDDLTSSELDRLRAFLSAPPVTLPSAPPEEAFFRPGVRVESVATGKIGTIIEMVGNRAFVRWEGRHPQSKPTSVLVTFLALPELPIRGEA